MGPSVQGWVLPHLVAWVDSQGFDSTPIRRMRGLVDLTDLDLRVPEASAETAWRPATTMTGDAAIGVHVAEALPRGALDLVVSQADARRSRNVGEAIHRLDFRPRVLVARITTGGSEPCDGCRPNQLLGPWSE
jgi:hypothetical protein